MSKLCPKVSLLWLLSFLALQCSGQTYSTFFKPFEIIFSSPEVPNMVQSATVYVPTTATTGYLQITFDEGTYSTPELTSGLTAASFTLNFNPNGGNTTAVSIACVTDTASTSCPGTPPAAGASQMRVHLNLVGAPHGVEQVTLFAAANQIYGVSKAPTPTSDNSGTVTLPNLANPTVINVTSTNANGYYKAGDTITVQLIFTEPVTVTGTPQLTLETGSTDAVVNYSSGSGTNTLNFVYTVAAGHNSADLDYESANALSLNGGTIQNSLNTNANLTLPAPGSPNSLAGNKNLVVDTAAPTVTNVTATNANGYYKAGDTITIQIVFSEPVNVTGTPQLTLTTGTPPTTAVNYVSGSGTSTLLFSYTVAANNLNPDLDYASTTALTAGTAIQDLAGNNAILTLPNPGASGSLGANKDLHIDAVVPAAPGTPDLLAASDSGVSNSDDITNLSTPQFSVSCENGASVQLYTDNPVAGTATGSAVTCSSGSATLTAGSLAHGIHNITARQTDPAGNQSVASAALAVTIDLIAPPAPGTPDMLAASDSGFSNSDNITNVTTPQFSVSCENSAIVQLYTDNPAAGTVTGSSGTCAGGSVTLTAATLVSGAHNISARQQDIAGNLSNYSTSLAVTIDTTAPGIPTSLALDSADDTGISNSDRITSQTTNLTFTGLAEANATVRMYYPNTSGTLVGTTTANGSGNWTLDGISLAQGLYSMVAVAEDAAGNVSAQSAAMTVRIDTTNPVISGTSPTTGMGVTSSAANVTFSEDCATASIVWQSTGGTGHPNGPHTRNLTGSELNAGTHTNIAFASNPLIGGSIYTVTWSCTDPAGNSATPVTANNVTYSDGPPVITSAVTMDTNYNGKIDTYKVTFNKNIVDSTFPGYVANSLGNAQTAWLVAGYTNVRLLHGSAVTFETDTANDAIIYIRFNENVLDCNASTQTGCDTDVKPDLTTTASPGVSDGVQTMGQVFVATVTEADGAAPVVVRALSLGPNSVDVNFSEPVNDVQANVAGNYVITGSGGLTVSNAVRDGSNYRIVHLTTSAQTGGASYTLTVNTTLRDLVNINLITHTNPNTGLPANQATFNGVTNPVVVNIVTTSATTLQITFNEVVTAATTECANPTACAAIYQNTALPVLSAVSTGGSGVNSATYILTVNPMIEGALYTTTVVPNTVTSQATGLKVQNVNNSATFTGDGKPAATISTDTQTQCPTPTNLPPSAPAATRVVVQYDQAVGASALTASNYKITGCLTGTDCASGTGAPNANGASVVTNMGANKYAVDFPQAFDTDTSQYQLTISNVQDLNGNTIAPPGNLSFRCGTDTTGPSLINVSVVSATAGSTIVLLTFSEAVDNVTGNVASNYAGDYAGMSTNWGQNVLTAARQTNTAQVLVTFQPALPNGGHQMGVRNVQDLAGNAILNNGLNNVQPFIVNAPTGFTGGPVFTDPFGDGTQAGTIVIYDGKLYLGPDNTSSKLFETNYSLTAAQTILLDADGTFGSPTSSFNGFLTKYTGCTTTFSNPPLPTEQCTTGTTDERDVEGIDTMYAACIGGSATPQLTGAACTAAGGTEMLFMAAKNTDVTNNAYYRSFWRTTDKSSSTTTFTFAEGYSGDTGGTAAYRAMNMIVFKDQLFMNFGAEQSGGGRGGRVCINPAGCTGASNSTYLSYVGLPSANRIQRIGASGSNTLRNGSYNGGSAPYADSNLGNQAFNAINVMYEYDNDGAGGNESQLYIANGGYSNSPLGSARTGNSDGGIMRTVLAYSTKTSLPNDCTTNGCLTFWEDVTPDSLTKWNSYYSIPYPQNTGASNPANCSTSFVEMDCVQPFNLFVPAIKAIPYMRTAPNGDLYLIRNACSTNNYARNGAANDFRTIKQVCPPSSEVPQLWMMPKNCGSAASCAAAWQLVAEYGTTGKTNMRGNNTIGANNTHITLLEFVGTYLYIGYDNATNGANVWRVDFNSPTCTGTTNCMTSGSKPAENQFQMVNVPGLDSGSGGTNQKIFSHITFTDAGKDWLIILTRDGSNAMKLYRTANDQN